MTTLHSTSSAAATVRLASMPRRRCGEAAAARQGPPVISCDPIYRLEPAQILERITAACDQVLDQTRQNAGDFVWDSIQSVEELGRVRMAAMRGFLEEYGAGRAQGRYVDAELPTLPFADASFDLALCSHFLFLYTSQLGEAFHRSAIREMCRVASEVRLFPLIALSGAESPFVAITVGELGSSGFDVSIEEV